MVLIYARDCYSGDDVIFREFTNFKSVQGATCEAIFFLEFLCDLQWLFCHTTKITGSNFSCNLYQNLKRRCKLEEKQIATAREKMQEKVVTMSLHFTSLFFPSHSPLLPLSSLCNYLTMHREIGLGLCTFMMLYILVPSQGAWEREWMPVSLSGYQDLKANMKFPVNNSMYSALT